MSEEKAISKLSFGRPRPRDSRFEAIAAAEIRLETRAEFVAEIVRLWREGQERLLKIGRYLLNAKGILPHGEFIAMIERDLPFSRSAAHKMMTVVRAIETEIVPASQLPPDYTSAYLVVTLTEDERRQATHEGLIRPNASRKELLDFRRKIRPQQKTPQKAAKELEENRRAALEAEKRRLLARLVEIRRELHMAK